MALRCLYLIARRVLELVLLRFRSQSYQELEIAVLRHELAILAARSPDPSCAAETDDDLEDLRALLKPRDARRLQALLDCRGDRRAAADRLGLPLETFGRQLRQTLA